MKRGINYIILLLIVMFCPMIIKAASVSVGLDCPSSATKGVIISCNIKINSDVKVNGLVVNYGFSGVSYVSFTPASGFTPNYSSSSGFNIGNNAGKSGSYTIGLLKVKVNSAGSITLKNIDISDVNFKSYSSSNKTKSIRIKSNNNNLAGLSLTGGNLSPSFNANTLNYTSTINSSSVVINATKGESNQSISGTGKKDLKYGKNTFNVVVKSEAGTSKTYVIVITRPDNRKKDNYLKSLSLDKGSISFKKDVLNYSVKVGNDVSTIKISASVNDVTASFVSGFGPRNVNLKYGANNVLIKVKAENGTIRTYTIKVNREDGRSKNNNLSSIKLSSGSINFSKNVKNYTVTVPYEVSKIDVDANAEDSKSKVTIDSPKLKIGDNKILITVKAENGSTEVYTVKVKRLEKQQELSNNNNVSFVNIKGREIDFKSDVFEYDVTIGDEYALVIDVGLEDVKANYVIEGNEDLKNGSVIKIISTSEKGETKTYKLNIIKKESSDKSGSHIIYGFVGFGIGVILTIIVMSIIKNKKNVSIIEVTSNKVISPSINQE